MLRFKSGSKKAFQTRYIKRIYCSTIATSTIKKDAIYAWNLMVREDYRDVKIR